MRDCLDLLPARRRLDEDDVRPGVGVHPPAPDRLPEPRLATRVGASDDQHLGSGVQRRSQLLNHLFGADELLSGVVAAFLRGDLVLDVNGSRAQTLKLAHGTDHADGVAIPGVGVSDHRQVRGIDHLSEPCQHLGHGEEAEVG